MIDAHDWTPHLDHPITGPESHAVALMAASASQAEVWDPLWGKRLFTPQELARRWRGFAIECTYLRK